MKKLKFFIQILIFIIGIILLIAGIIYFIQQDKFFKNSVTSKGLVIDNVHKGDWAFYPKIQFEIDNGTKIVFQSKTYSPTYYFVGEIVNISYDPINPHEAQIDSIYHQFFFPIFMIIFGIVLIIITIISFLYNKN